MDMIKRISNTDYDIAKLTTYMTSFGEPEAVTDIAWERIKGHILPCLTSPGGNFQRAQELVHSSFLDLHIYYYVRMKDDDQKKISIVWIRDMQLIQWGIDLQTLNTQALKNLMKDRYTIRHIDDVLNGFSDIYRYTAKETARSFHLYVLTNQGAFFGAAGVLDKSIVSAFADKVGHDLFIIPSSIHEVMLCPDFGYVTAEEMSRIVQEVNCAEVLPHDRLSNHVYYYDRGLDEIRSGI